MYASQSRGNTKYADFLRNYFPADGTKSVNNNSTNNNNKNISNLPLGNSALLAQSEPLLAANSENRTKFSDLFSKPKRSNSNPHGFSKDPKFEKLTTSNNSPINNNGMPKVFSDPNILQLHHNIVNSFNEVKGPNETKKEESEPISGQQRPAGSSEGSNPAALLNDLERNLQKLNEETIQLLNRAKSNSISHLEDVVTQAGSEHVSYHDILKAEHIALRRELLNSIREISRATFFEDLYKGRENGGGGDGNGRKVIGENQGEGKPDDPDAFHLNQDTADPKERVDEWIRSSQEHLNKPTTRRRSSARSVASVLTEKPHPLHASLYLDSAWHGNEDEDDVPPADLVDDPEPVTRSERLVGKNRVIQKDFTHTPILRQLTDPNRSNVEQVSEIIPAPSTVTTSLPPDLAQPRTESGKAKMRHSPPEIAHNTLSQHGMRRRWEARELHENANSTLNANKLKPVQSHAPEPSSSTYTVGNSKTVRAELRSRFYRSTIADVLTCGTEREDMMESRRRPKRRPLKRTQSFSIVRQPTTEKFPPRIYDPRKRYSRTLKKLALANDTSVPAPSRPIHTIPLIAFAKTRRSKSLDDGRSRTHYAQLNELPQTVPQVESQTVGYMKNPKIANGRNGGKVPGILRRQNMDQWVAKKVWFYVNGDEHRPKFEYRFRPKRDVKDLDALCDLLSNRLNLPRGVRFIFTMDGVPVEKLDDLKHEHHYVVSSIKKFKVTPYKDFYKLDGSRQPQSFPSHLNSKSMRQSV